MCVRSILYALEAVRAERCTDGISKGLVYGHSYVYMLTKMHLEAGYESYPLRANATAYSARGRSRNSMKLKSLSGKNSAMV